MPASERRILELGLDKICRKIEKKHRNKYDLDAILQMLLYTRILYPGSKLSSLEDAKRFIAGESCTAVGEMAEYTSYTLNQEMIDQQPHFESPKVLKIRNIS